MKARNVSDVYPLTPMQQGMLFHTRQATGQHLYCVQWSARLTGELDPRALQAAWEHVVALHPPLRTAFLWEGTDEPLQIVREGVKLPWAEEDWRALSPEEQERRLEERLDEDARRGFDPRRAPLLRLLLLRTAFEVHRLLLGCYHPILDGWSMNLVLRQVFEAYRDLRRGITPEPRAPRPFRDYLVWLQDCDRAAEERYWRGALAGFRAPTPLVIDRRGGPLPGAGHSPRRRVLSTETSEALSAFTRRHRLTVGTLLQGAWALLLARYGDAEDVLFGTSVSGRPPELPGVESMVGLFINTLPVRVAVPRAATVLPWLEALHAQLASARQHGAAALVDVHGYSEAPRDRPLFESLFVFENYPLEGGGHGDAGLAVDDLRFRVPTGIPLVITAFPGPRLTLEITFDAARFEEAAIDRMAGHMERLIEGMIADPGRPLRRIPLLGEREQAELGAPSAVRSYPSTPGLHERFAAQAARTPDAIALSCEGRQLSYGALRLRSRRLARRLRQSGVGPEVRVGLCAERSSDLVVGILGILEAGGAYVPLDPSYPRERLAYLIDDARVPVLVTQEKLAASMPVHAAEMVLLDANQERFEDGPFPPPAPAAMADRLAYVIYTSGSTGRPKGVEVTHGNVVRLFEATQARFGFGPDDVWTLFHSFSFDFSVWEIWGALLHGGRLVVVPHRVSRDARAFRDLLADERVTVLNQTPLAFRQLAGVEEEDGADPRDLALRLVILGGEALELTSLRPWLARRGDRRPGIVNMYGITETTVHVTCRPITAADLDAAPGSMIGGAIPDLALHLLDRELGLVPVGVPGEICVGGAGVARGYLGRPELTAERFVPDPFGPPGSRLYRSGDVGRRLESGDLEYLGRSDQQVKIRGFRVELGEIEAALAGDPAVREVVVAFRPERGGRLVAYVVLAGEAVAALSRLRASVRQRLPEHMIPQLLPLPALPLTAHGKIDRRALPAPEDSRPDADPPRAGSVTPEERAVAAMMAEIIGIAPPEPHESFFDLGGHSLSATRLVARVREAFGVDLPLRALFDEPTVAGIARAVAARRGPSTEPSEGAIPSAPRGDRLPLSWAQQRLWFLDQLDPGSAAYNMPICLRLRGPLDLDALARSLSEVVRRHEVLRTVYESRDGDPVQVIRPAEEVPLARIDLRVLPEEARLAQASELARAEARCPFDLAMGPVLRATAVLLGAEDHVVLLTLHHIAGDGWSMALLVAELAELYPAAREGRVAPLPPLPIQYASYAAWQRRQLDGAVLERQLGFWRSQLAGLPVLELPTDRPRPAQQTFRGAIHRALVPPEIADGLRALGREEGATLFMTLLGAFGVLLHRHAGQDDIVVGAPIAGRTRAETEHLIGFFINTLVLRLDLAGSPTFRELVRRVREVCLGAFAHQDVPFERLVEALQPERDLSRTPLFQVMFALHPAVPRRSLEGLSMEPFDATGGTAKFDLTVDCVDEGEAGIAVSFDYNLDLWDPVTIERMVGHFLLLLARAAVAPDERVGRMPLLEAAERRRLLVAWNRTDHDFPRDLCLHQLVEAQAARTPDAVAVSFEGQRLRYRELDARAARLAATLRRHGVGPDRRVAVFAERSLSMMVGLLAVLKAGGAYLPLDPRLPADRLRFMLEDGGADVVLTLSRLLSSLPEQGARVILLDEDFAEDGLASPPAIGPLHLAYVIYTSGSTGRPKGVMIPHRAICNQLLFRQQAWPLGIGDRFLAKATFAFDVSLYEMFGPLIAGAEVVLARPGGERDPAYLADLIAREGVTVALFAPSMLQVFLEEEALLSRCRSLRHVFCGGEALSAELARKVFARLPHARLHHLYGPTETCVDSTFFDCTPERLDRAPPIGRPVDNTQLYVLDPQREPVPVGVPGEIYLGGVQLARGYLGDPSQTAERFVPDPFSSTPGARLYRSGDRARFRRDGDVEFLGRFGHQVKIRGYRVELGEIEAVLESHPGVREAAVEGRVIQGDRRLIAYVVAATEPPPTVADLGDHLRGKLPEYMVPRAFVALPDLPRTPNGKRDRRALPTPDAGAFERQGLIAPRDALEQGMVQIWEALLAVRPVGVEDDFFALGGHSLLAVQLCARVRRELGRELPLAALFEARTAARLCELLRDREGRPPARASALVPLATGGARRPFFCVHPLGGTVFCFAELARALGPDQPFYGLTAQGLSDGAAPLDRIEAMADAYLADVRRLLPRGPYRLGGYSMGGLVAFEMARRLEAAGEEVALLALIDSVPLSPALRALPAVDDAVLLADALGLPFPSTGGPLDATLREAERAGALPPGIDSAQLERLLAMLRAHREAMRAFAPAPWAGRVTLFLSHDGVTAGGAPGWEALGAVVEPHYVSGDHHTLLRAPHVGALAGLLGERLSATQNTTRPPGGFPC